MGADHAWDPTQDRDEMSRDGVLVILELDDAGIPVVKVSTTQGAFVRIDHNDDTVHAVEPSQDERDAMIEATAEAEKARTMLDRLGDAIRVRMGAATDADSVAMIAVEEMVKLTDAAKAEQAADAGAVEADVGPR